MMSELCPLIVSALTVRTGALTGGCGGGGRTNSGARFGGALKVFGNSKPLANTLVPVFSLSPAAASVCSPYLRSLASSQAPAAAASALAVCLRKTNSAEVQIYRFVWLPAPLARQMARQSVSRPLARAAGQRKRARCSLAHANGAAKPASVSPLRAPHLSSFAGRPAGWKRACARAQTALVVLIHRLSAAG